MSTTATLDVEATALFDEVADGGLFDFDDVTRAYFRHELGVSDAFFGKLDASAQGTRVTRASFVGALVTLSRDQFQKAAVSLRRGTSMRRIARALDAPTDEARTRSGSMHSAKNGVLSPAPSLPTIEEASLISLTDTMSKLLQEAQVALTANQPDTLGDEDDNDEDGEDGRRRTSLDQDTRLQEMRERVRRTDEDLYVMQQENIRLKKRCFDTQESLFEAVTNFDSLQLQLNARNEEIAQLRKQNDELRAQVARLETTVFQQNERDEARRARIQKMDRALLAIQDDLRSERVELMRQIKLMQEGDQETRQTALIAQLTQDLEAARKEIATLQRATADSKRKSTAVAEATMVDQLQTVISGLTDQIAELKAENATLQRHNDNYRDVLSEAELKRTHADLPSPDQVALQAEVASASMPELQKRVTTLTEETRAYKAYMDRLLDQIMRRDDLMFLLLKQ